MIYDMSYDIYIYIYINILKYIGFHGVLPLYIVLFMTSGAESCPILLDDFSWQYPIGGVVEHFGLPRASIMLPFGDHLCTTD